MCFICGKFQNLQVGRELRANLQTDLGVCSAAGLWALAPPFSLPLAEAFWGRRTPGGTRAFCPCWGHCALAVCHTGPQGQSYRKLSVHTAPCAGGRRERSENLPRSFLFPYGVFSSKEGLIGHLAQCLT